MRIVVVQEPPDEIPSGTTPRTLQCCYRLLPESAFDNQIRPGDKLKLSGFLMPQPSLSSIYRIEQIFVIQTFEQLNQANININDLQLQQKLNRQSNEQRINTLIHSFAPSIYGHEMPKLACLCALVGGCSASVKDISIRQNINLLLIGDPGVAKSQLLKFTSMISTRGIYISGRGATGAGLTAAVMRIGNGSEFSIEPGALILADRGVCCIDEFDKLLDEDRTAIYEVLEQQTISISKAGVNASLNARTTVCAAANPRYSKWDETKSLKENIDLPEALVSRFDCLFVMRDVVDEERDRNLGQYVAEKHRDVNQQQKDEKQTQQAQLTLEELKKYLSECNQLKPQLKPELINKYVECYVSDRQEKEFTTPRALLATVRLSQAVAKLRQSPYVDDFDIDTARQLIKASEESASNQRILSSKQNNHGGNDGQKKLNVNTTIKALLKEYGGLEQQELAKKCKDRGISEAEFEKAIDRLNILGVVDSTNGVWKLM